MIFAIIGEELGLVGAAAVMARLRRLRRTSAFGSRSAARTRSASGSRRA
jgi:cell division protein FtsW (lipid II flippase)